MGERLVVGASGGGTTFRAVADTLGENLTDAYHIAAVISDRAEPGVFEQVKEVNDAYGTAIVTETVLKRDFPEWPQPRGQTLAQAEETCALLDKHGADALALMGWMSIVGEPLITERGWLPGFAAIDPAHQGIYFSDIINTHPGSTKDTPDTYGLKTQETVLAKGLPQAAQTLHVVTIGVDTGPIIAERRFDVPRYELGTDARREAAAKHLFGLVQSVEKAHLPFDIAQWLEERHQYRREHLQEWQAAQDLRRQAVGDMVLQLQETNPGYKPSVRLQEKFSL